MNYWEKVYQGNNNYYSNSDPESYEFIASLIPSGSMVLDLGCGTGTLFEVLKKGTDYCGLDYSATAIEVARKRYPKTEFYVADTRRLKDFKENTADFVVMRHFLENQEDWRETIRQAFRIANKAVIMVINRNFLPGDEPSRILENPDDTWVWDINHGDINMVCRQLSVNTAFGKLNDREQIVYLGKHLDDAVFELDDFHDNNHNLPILLDLKKRFPDLKVGLFCIPSLCTVEFINDLKAKYGDWMRFYVHGWYHDTVEHGTAQEANYWDRQQAGHFLWLAEKMGCFEKVWRAPGWNENYETVAELVERGYILCQHLGHDRWEELGGKRYVTGHLWEVHGHVQNVNMNGLEELATTKCNFGPHTKFHFIEDAPEVYLPNRYQ